jgi:nucleoid DNA-binding protein
MAIKKSASRKTTRSTAKKSSKKWASGKGIATKKAAVIVKTVVQPWNSGEKTRTSTRPRNSNTLSYTMSEFLENVKGFCGLRKRSEAKELCEDLSSFIRDSLKRGYKIPLMGLGKMYVRESKARQGRNPQTGEIVNIPARKRVRFSAAKALKEAVL